MNKRIVNISLILLLGSTGSVLAQQGIGTNRPHKSAAVEIESTNKGLLIPRMELKWEDEKIVAPTIDSPAIGLLVFNNKNTAAVPEGFYYFSNALWNPIGVSELDSSTTTTITGNGTASNPYKIEVKELKGDVTGSILTNKVVKIQGVPVSSDTPTNGQVLKIDSGTWTPSTLKGSDISDPKNLTANGPLHVDSGTGAVLKDVTLRVDTATKSSLGVVQIGEGINVNNGVISVPPTPGETTTYLNFDSSTTNLTYLSEDTSTSSLTLNLGDVIRGNQNNTFVTGSTPINIDSSTVGRNTTYNVSVDTATATTLGIVKPGIGLTIDSGSLNVDTTAQGIGKNISTDGLILVNDSTTLQNSVLANTSLKIKAGNEGQVLTTVANKPTWVDPTADKVTTLAQDTTTGVITYINEASSTTTANIVNNETSNIIKYNNGAYLTQGDVQNNQIKYEVVNGVNTNVTLDTATLNVVKYKVDVNLDGSETKLTNGTNTTVSGTGTDANKYAVNVATADTNTLGVVKPGTGLTINQGTLNVDLNTADIQQLSLDSNTLSLERGGSVDLAKYLDNTDSQSLSFDTSTNVLSITGDSNTVDFTNYKNKAYSLASDTNTISLLADGTSVGSETVVKNVALSLSTDKKLTATVNGVPSTTPLDLSIINTDNQYLTFDTSTNTLAISGDSRTVQVITKLDTGTNTTLIGNGTAATPYTVNVATADTNTLGVVKIGSGINVTNGVISVPAAPGETTTVIANTLTKNNKKKIADYKNETTNTPVDIYETVTALVYDTATNVTHVSEDTSTLVFNLGDEVRKNQKTTTVVGNGAVKVTPTSANTTGNTAYTVSVDTATATTLGVVKPGTGITITADGTLNVLPQADTVTTLTGVKPTGNAIGTYKNEAGTDVVINETITSIKFDSTTSVLTYTPETGESGTIELNLSSINSDKQQLSLDTNTLKLERSESVDLSKYLDNTDNQSLSFDTSSHILKITGDSNTIDFSNYKNKVYTLVSDTNTISLLADGASIDSETVVKNVALSLSTDKKLTATVNGVPSTTPLDLSTINTDNQYLTFDTSTNTLAISGDSRTVQVITKLDTGTNTTLTGNGTAGMPYKVGVSNATAKVGATAGTLGVVKPGEQFKVETDGHLSVKYAMPEFFYYPAINIKLDTNTLDLYGIYKSRFESSTMIKSANTEQPNLAALVLPVNMIDIYVTYYDSNVINTMQISNEGVMTYTLKSTYTITDESYMNIVFKVRKSPRP